MSEATNLYLNLNDQQQFRLNKINEIKEYSIAEISERILMSKRLSKYIAHFNYFYESLIFLQATIGSVSIVSSATVIVAPVGVASFSFPFSITVGIVKKLLKITHKKIKSIMIILLCQLEVN